MQELKKRATELIHDGTVVRVLGWKDGEFAYDPQPAFFTTEQELSQLAYHRFCSANLSKFLVEASKKEGKTLVFLKPCDTYSYQQLVKEHRVDPEKIYAVGVGCKGNLDIEKIRAAGIRGIVRMTEEDGRLHFDTLYGERSCHPEEVLLERCRFCKGKEHMACQEKLLGEYDPPAVQGDRFGLVKELEAMEAKERFAFWKRELSRCIRCNACRNACPACTCRKCVFDSDKFDSAQKVNADSFEEKMFHIIRAFHVAGRCTDCGECSRVCPQNIPLFLLNRKLILDVNRFYGEYQAGADPDGRSPLTDFAFDDAEPGMAGERR